MVIETFGVGSIWLDSLFTPFLFSLLNTVNGMGLNRCRENLLHLACGRGANNGHVDGALAVDVDVKLVEEADSSRRSNDGPTANCQRNLVILEWRGATDACLLACSRNRRMKMLFPIYNYSLPQILLPNGPNGAQKKKYLTASCSL